MHKIHGFCEPRFKAVEAVFQRHFDEQKEVGASFSAYLKGQRVIDLWAGHVDARKTQTWNKDTIVNVFSTTKIMGSLCLLMLVDRGLVDLNTPVAKYWPEFGQAGKGNIPVKYLLSHSSGVSGFDQKITVEDLYDSDKMAAMLAAQKPWWTPGTRSGYQTVSFSFLIGHLVKLVSGKTLGTFFRDEIANPLGIDFHIGTPVELDPRIADIVSKPVPVSWIEKSFLRVVTPMTAKGILNPDPNKLVPAANTRAWRACELPSSNGHGNARSVAQVGAILAGGGSFGGKELLSSKTVDAAITRQIRGWDRVLCINMEWGLGFQLNAKTTRIGPRSFGWYGYGGSSCIMDRDLNASVAYVMNNCSNNLLTDRRAAKLFQSFRSCL